MMRKRIAKILHKVASWLEGRGSHEENVPIENDLSGVGFINQHSPMFLNACVGRNGATQDSYFDGYEKMVKLICSYLLQNHGEYIDSFIYPFFYGIRHVVELKLKLILHLTNLIASFHYKDITHSISDLWNYVEVNTKKIDCQLINPIFLCKKAINDLILLDDSGQVFRYRIDSNGVLNLKNANTINLAIAYKEFAPVFKNLDNIICVLRQIIEWDIPFQKRLNDKFNSYKTERSFHFIKKAVAILSDYDSLPLKDKYKILKQKLKLGSNKINILKTDICKTFFGKYSLNSSYQMSYIVRRLGRCLRELKILQNYNQTHSSLNGLDIFSCNPSLIANALLPSLIEQQVKQKLLNEKSEVISFAASLLYIGLHETDCCEYEYDDVLENPCKYAGDNLIEYIMEKISPYDCIVNGYEKLNMRFMCPRFGEKFKYV
ncbi:MAG: hypothetical protein IJM92_11160 [Fibrobacter sp.]|uniref:hypothetical protein n=1 Tax=Fibrobacter sp. TaxID=35828 RepID=UPI0025BF1B95|nr:hypothetical protein [Fibrobacter sp.]MBQ7080191.1 hypothetical protein [Fibrobacter sp.]